MNTTSLIVYNITTTIRIINFGTKDVEPHRDVKLFNWAEAINLDDVNKLN